jgi:hypothetical protein
MNIKIVCSSYIFNSMFDNQLIFLNVNKYVEKFWLIN